MMAAWLPAADLLSNQFFQLDRAGDGTVLRLVSSDGTNRLTRACVLALTAAVRELSPARRPLIITGNDKFFSAGAELAEIVALNGPAAYEFSLMGQALMDSLDQFPAPVLAAVSGYCMGGGFDLALACDMRIAHPHAVFGHRGAALGLITGWGGTQRLPRLVGRGRALQMFVESEKLHASDALRIGLVSAIDMDPLRCCLNRVSTLISSEATRF
jgi:enoyl-CoA hydratase/carnithine racemase